MSNGFKADLVYLAPVLVSLLFGVACASLLMWASIKPYNVAPFPEDPVGSVGNAFYFVLLVGAGATLLLFLLKTRSHRLIAFVTGFALTTAFFTLSLIYLFAAFSFAPLPRNELAISGSIVITAFACYIIFKTRSKIGDFIVILLGGALGTFLGASIQTLSTVLILCFLAVYDAIAVYRGPVGKIAKEGLERFRGLSFSFKDVQMGLGDLTFYSMLSGHMLLNFGFLSCTASIMGILAGCFLTFKILEKQGMFPGLPFPIIFGLVSGFLAALF
ncbi:MAG: presenilin family intramembrane aspartyl protease [Candidatus Bathyarchaeales archaeon]